MTEIVSSFFASYLLPLPLFCLLLCGWHLAHRTLSLMFNLPIYMYLYLSTSLTHCVLVPPHPQEKAHKVRN